MSWNGSNLGGAEAPKVEAVKKAPSTGKGLLAGLVVVVLAAVAVWFFVLDKDVDEPKEEQAPSKTIAEKSPRTQPLPTNTRKSVKKTAASIAREYNEQAKEFVKKAPTNDVVWLVKPLDPNDPDYALHSQVAMEIRTLIAVMPGDPMPPVPFSFMQEDDARKAAMNGDTDVKINDGTDDFIKLIREHKIAAKDGDDEAALNRKLDFLNAQEELLKGVDDGLSVNDSIRAAYEFRQRAHELRNQIVEGLREYVEAGEDINETRKSLKEMNDKLAEEGIRSISGSDIGIEDEEEQINE